MRFSRKLYFLRLFSISIVCAICKLFLSHCPVHLQFLQDHRSLKTVLHYIYIYTYIYIYIYIYKENNGAKIKSCGTAAWIVFLSDIWPLRKTLWNLPFKKLEINLNKFPPTPFCLNLNNNPLCQILSNPLDM